MLDSILKLRPKKYGSYNDLEILPYLLKNNCVKCIMYGTGDMGRWMIDWLKKTYSIVPDFIIDREPKSNILDGIEVIDIEELKRKEKGRYFVIVAEEEYKEPEYRRGLSDLLKRNGAVTIFNANRIVEPFWPSWYVFIKDNIQKFELLYDCLCDDLSKDTMIHYLKTYITGERYGGGNTPRGIQILGERQ